MISMDSVKTENFALEKDYTAERARYVCPFGGKKLAWKISKPSNIIITSHVKIMELYRIRAKERIKKKKKTNKQTKERETNSWGSRLFQFHTSTFLQLHCTHRASRLVPLPPRQISEDAHQPLSFFFFPCVFPRNQTINGLLKRNWEWNWKKPAGRGVERRRRVLRFCRAQWLHCEQLNDDSPDAWHVTANR